MWLQRLELYCWGQATVLLRQRRRRQLECRTPLPERTSLVLDSVVTCGGSASRGEGNLCPLTWVSDSVGPARPLGYLMVTNLHWRRTRRPWCSGSAPEEGFPSGEGVVGTDTVPAGNCPGSQDGLETGFCRGSEAGPVSPHPRAC